MNLIFDLDGTLIDSAPDVTDSLNHALRTGGFSPIPIELVKTFLGRGAKFLVEKTLEYNGELHGEKQVKHIEESFVKIYSENPVEKTTLFPGVRKTLEALLVNKIEMALCTNKPRKTTLPVLKKLGMEKYFSAVCCGDDVKHPKPDGRHVIASMTKFRDPAKLTIMVGDTENDIVAAKYAGIASIYVTFGYNLKPNLETFATAFINDFSEFPEIINAISQQHSTS